MSEGQQAKTAASSTGVDATKKSEPMLYFHPGSATILCVDAAGARELEQEHNFLNDLLQKQMMAQLKLDEANYKALTGTTIRTREVEKDLDAAYKALNEANEKLRAELMVLTNKVPEGELLDENAKESAIGLMELIPLKKGSTKGFKMTHVRSDKIKNHWRRYKLSEIDKKSGEASFVKYKNEKITVTQEQDGKEVSVEKEVRRAKIDGKELKKQLIELEAKYKHELTLVEDSSVILGEWAKEMNKDFSWSNNKGSDKKEDGQQPVYNKYVDLTAQAQLMRFSQGVGAEAEFNPLEKKITGKIAGHASFALGEAKAEAALYMPDRLGIGLQFPGKNESVCNMGALRFAITTVLSGNAGASLAIEVGVEMDWSGDMAEGYGIKGKPAKLSSGGTPGNRKINLLNSIPPPDNKGGGEIGAFVGVQAGANVSGAIEWFDPEPEKEEEKGDTVNTDERKFTAIAKLELGGGLQAGGGGSGVFYITYIQSRFRIYCKASLCWGVGAKGSLGFEVDGNHLMAFMKSFMYMLRNADYQKLSDMMAGNSFKALCAIPLIMAMQGVQAADAMLSTIEEFFTEIEKDIKSEDKRVKLMDSILENPDQLKYTPPETKGAIIAQLIDTNWVDWNDSRNQNNDFFSINSWKLGPLKRRKQAVFLALRWVQSQADFNNVMQHLTIIPGAGKGNEELNKQSVIKFLSIGEFKFPGFTNYGEKLNELYTDLPIRVNENSLFKPIPDAMMNEYLAMVDQQHPNLTMIA